MKININQNQDQNQVVFLSYPSILSPLYPTSHHLSTTSHSIYYHFTIHCISHSILSQYALENYHCAGEGDPISASLDLLCMRKEDLHSLLSSNYLLLKDSSASRKFPSHHHPTEKNPLLSSFCSLFLCLRPCTVILTHQYPPFLLAWTILRS